MPKVKFEINAEKELEYLGKFVAMSGKDKVIPEALNLLKLDKAKAIAQIKEKYLSKDFLDFSNNLKQSWQEIELFYFKKIEKITDNTWQFEEYRCFISYYVPGFSDISSKQNIILGKVFNKKGAIIELPIESQRYVLAHELFHLHYFSIARKEQMPLIAAQLKMVETIPVIVFFSDEELKRLWPSVTLENARRSYQEVDLVFDKLILLYQKRKSYLDFMHECIAFLDKEEII